MSQEFLFYPGRIVADFAKAFGHRGNSAGTARCNLTENRPVSGACPEVKSPLLQNFKKLISYTFPL